MFEIVVQCHGFISNQFKSIQFSFIQVLINFESHQAHQNLENPSNMGVRVPSKRFPSSPLKNALCHPPGPQVMQYVFSCFFPGYGGHRCRTYTPVFYKGVFLILSPVFFALGSHHSLEKMASKEAWTPPIL